MLHGKRRVPQSNEFDKHSILFPVTSSVIIITSERPRIPVGSKKQK